MQKKYLMKRLMLLCMITGIYRFYGMDAQAQCPFCRTILTPATRGNSLFIVNLNELIPNAQNIFVICHMNCLIEATNTHTHGRMLIDAPLAEGFPLSAFIAGHIYQQTPVTCILHYMPTEDQSSSAQQDMPSPENHPTADYRHIHGIEQIMSRYNEERGGFDLCDLGIEHIDESVFAQMARMPKEVRWLDISCNSIIEPPTALNLLPAVDLFVQVDGNPFQQAPSWLWCKYNLHYDNPGWIIVDNTPQP